MLRCSDSVVHRESVCGCVSCGRSALPLMIVSAEGAVRTTTPQARTAPRQPLPDAAPLVQHAARGHSLREVLLEVEVRHGEAAQAAVGEAGAQHVPVPAGASEGWG